MKFNSLIETDTRIFGLFFLYISGVAFLVQLVVLPYLFPAWHAGNGLLVGGDWIHFHELASNMAAKIHQMGWSAWNICPEGQAPAGIAAAIYAIVIPKPWVLIPFNAILHASSALLIIKLIRFFLPQKSYALVCGLPFLLYPSSATWYAQIHRDGMSILGTLLVLYGWILISEIQNISSTRALKSFIRSVFFISGGILFLGVSRPYMLHIVKVESIFILVCLTLAIFFSERWSNNLARLKIASSLIAWSILPFIMFLSAQITPAKVAIPSTLAGLNLVTASDTASGFDFLASDYPDPRHINEHWKATSWMPTIIENNFKTVALARDGFRLSKPNAPSNVDAEIGFSSAADVIGYIPRALQIGFFAPFPNQWFQHGSLPSNTMMRKISAIETIGIYVCILFLPLAIWTWRRRLSLWIILSFCLLFLTLYSEVIVNIGTLYRSRYVFSMLLSALGLAGFLSYWNERKLKELEQT